MTAALLATYVDEGTLGWDQPVIDAWSGFRAPTDELTRALRVRDLVGMASGLGEPLSTSLRFGGPTTEQLLQSVVNLPVINEPGAEFYYNNTLYAVGGYLPLLASGIAPADVRPAYTQAMHDRLFAPAGMTGAQIADDPRGLVVDYATGNQFDLRSKATTLPFGPIGSHTPAGGALASLRDMAAWVRLQLRQGVSVDGGQVVSAANLAECWKAHVTTPAPGELDPDYVSAGYAMGWLNEEYKDSSSLIWHNGAIDGFASYIGFLPQHDVGLVVLNGMTSTPIGNLFYTYVLNLLLSEQLGLNVGVPDKVLADDRLGVRRDSPARPSGRTGGCQRDRAVSRLLRGRLLARTRRARPTAADQFAGYAARGHARRQLRHVRRVHGRSAGQARHRERRRPPRRDRRSRDRPSHHRLRASPTSDASDRSRPSARRRERAGHLPHEADRRFARSGTKHGPRRSLGGVEPPTF